ncbi:SRA stem-loop-interacting RNA-binding protein, mitochondrial [Sceloporus undulatus]|uniref:SRA stem-loop-interacting RNA-binding protein, mitochondrial n=1 Tax=Sceloporus undulatus TaxID=8520 RepID=UPI001C4D897A|nr:SRA stem-loop-interacting RNA-binding protein, mitochondrial [Sceloporus undulatus]
MPLTGHCFQTFYHFGCPPLDTSQLVSVLQLWYPELDTEFEAHQCGPINLYPIPNSWICLNVFCLLLFTDDVREYFAQFGTVKKCLLPFDKETGFHKGFCWVGFSTEEGLKNALQKDSHILEGVKLDVKHQRNRVFPGQHSDRRIADIS